jgi:hypothetical protein
MSVANAWLQSAIVAARDGERQTKSMVAIWRLQKRHDPGALRQARRSADVQNLIMPRLLPSTISG